MCGSLRVGLRQLWSLAHGSLDLVLPQRHHSLDLLFAVDSPGMKWAKHSLRQVREISVVISCDHTSILHGH